MASRPTLWPPRRPTDVSLTDSIYEWCLCIRGDAQAPFIYTAIRTSACHDNAAVCSGWLYVSKVSHKSPLQWLEMDVDGLSLDTECRHSWVMWLLVAGYRRPHPWRWHKRRIHRMHLTALSLRVVFFLIRVVPTRTATAYNRWKTAVFKRMETGKALPVAKGIDCESMQHNQQQASQQRASPIAKGLPTDWRGAPQVGLPLGPSYGQWRSHRRQIRRTAARARSTAGK